MKSRLDEIKKANPVLEMQFNLKNIAHCDSDIPMVKPSGIYDEQTRRAVDEFQKKFNLPVTGKVNYETWTVISKAHDDSIHELNTPSSVFCFPENIREYKRGDEGNLIFILQIILGNFHKRYNNYPDIQLTGIFDEQTETAIKQFQMRSKLPATGRVDKKTWNMMNMINGTCKLYE